MSSAVVPGRMRSSAVARPRLGFLGVGWIGRHRMECIAEADCASVAAVADAAPELADAAVGICADATVGENLDDLLEAGLDGIVIATPSALHAEQSIRALESGCAVFCQKPLGRTAAETRRVLDAACRADRLLGVDLSYRYARGMQRIRSLIAEGAIGPVFAADLVFHNAYGPDKTWYRDPQLSGGGCVIDLGIHLVDLALWALGGPAVDYVSSRLFAKGRRLAAREPAIEDYAVARIDLAGGAVANLACSWNLSAGCDAEIRVTFHGAEGALELRNLGGSFYDLQTLLYRGTSREVLDELDNEWGGRAAVAWARQLANDPRFDPSIAHAADVARIIDRIYGRPMTEDSKRDSGEEREGD